MWNPVLTIATCVMVLMSPLGVRASEIYVDNVSGNDRYNGRAQEPASDQVGPVRTLARALSLITGSDALILTKTGVPYEESMILSGGRLSGSPGVPPMSGLRP